MKTPVLEFIELLKVKKGASKYKLSTEVKGAINE